MKSRIVLTIILLCAIASLALAWVIPVPPHLQSDPDAFRTGFGLANFTNVLAIGTALLFFSGLNGFKTDLKKAYYFICAGLLVQAAGTLYYTIASLSQTVERSLIGDLPITIGSALMFVGIWKLARVLKVGAMIAQPIFIAALAAIVSVAALLIPLQSGAPSHLEHLNHVLEAFFYPLGAFLLWKIMRSVSTTYARSFTWMFIAIAGNFVASALFLGKVYMQYPDWAGEATLGILFIIDSFVYVAAGYSFSTILQRFARRQTANSTIDIIVFVAGLASQPKNIDPMLDRLRDITSAIATDSKLSDAQEQRLAQVYQELENYLITNEPLRDFTRQSLRTQIQNKFERLPVGITVEGNS